MPPEKRWGGESGGLSRAGLNIPFNLGTKRRFQPGLGQKSISCVKVSVVFLSPEAITLCSPSETPSRTVTRRWSHGF